MAGDEKKASQKLWLGMGEKSTYVFDDFENIAYLFYLLDIHPFMGYIIVTSMPILYRELDETINRYVATLNKE